MKKFVFLFLTMGLWLYTSAQVIEIVGIGSYDQSDVTIPAISDPDNVTKVILNAHYKESCVVTFGPGVMDAISDISFSVDNVPENITYSA